MTVLFLSDNVPMFDRAAGDLRLFIFLKILAAKYQVVFHAFNSQEQSSKIGENEFERYKNALLLHGVDIVDDEWMDFVKSRPIDVVVFEFYYLAAEYLDSVRLWQPKARLVVDTVDLHYRRLLSKARLTRNDEDYREAETMKALELGIYRKAEVVLTVTEIEKKALLEENCDVHVAVIPTIHPTPTVTNVRSGTDRRRDLIFIGGFNHEPNVDAIIYFCSDIFPSIRGQVPGVTLKIVGNAPPDSVRQLAGDAIEVTGYVPDTKLYLESSSISIAPLRYGGGMKGKIGEAMSVGLPVVTTSIGIEGIGLSPGSNVLLGDTPEEFSSAVVRLISDKELYDRLSHNARNFIEENYSENVVAEKVYSLFDSIYRISLKRPPWCTRWRRTASDVLGRHILWRFNKASKSLS
jgi:glycosyltransferase involved in cell wall biosynthesis